MAAQRQIGSTAACLLVRDVRAAAEHYAARLGFETPQLYGEPEITFAIPQRDDISIMLARANDGMPLHANSTDFGMFSAYFWVRDVDTLHAEFAAKGADITQPPEDREYGIREIYVRDLDGHLLCFGSDLEEGVH